MTDRGNGETLVRLADRYLAIIREVLLGQAGIPAETLHRAEPVRLVDGAAARALARSGMVPASPAPRFTEDIVDEGKYWTTPEAAYTMVGRRRLDHLVRCASELIEAGVPGDLIETGVWRGGATIMLRAVLEAHGVTDRRVFVADSFSGLPPPDPVRHPLDADSTLHEREELVVGLDEVKANFARLGLLDERVVFVPGWFADTLPGLASERWALVRLDGDMYGSTLDGLEHLYPRLSPGGYLIIDDYGAYPGCRAAVDEYRTRHGITADLQIIDWSGVCWRKPA